MSFVVLECAMILFRGGVNLAAGMRSLLFCIKGMHYLRPRGHSYTLYICPNNPCKSSFIFRCLFCVLWSLLYYYTI